MLVTDPADLNLDKLLKFKPDFIFFPHWSHIVKSEVFLNFKCIIFHMTDLPFGRGGSPLQNLILNGIENTVISAIDCVKDVDAGSIYLKKPLSLSGSATQIFERASMIIHEMILEILCTKIEPYPQMGVPTFFKRRIPSESNIANLTDLKKIYDYIRMLDADGYPHAYIANDSVRFEFKNAHFVQDEIIATVRIRKK